MKRLIIAVVVLLALGSSGCGSRLGSAGAGAVGGAAVGVGGYEWKLKNELDRIEKEFQEGRMDKKEYEIRKDQIQRLSIAQ